MEIIFYGFAFWFGGTVYQSIELFWRKKTHWSMFLAGGLVLMGIELICNGIFYGLPLPLKCLIGGLMITLIEFSVGCVVNLGMGLNVWDYSGHRVQILGQISLFYSALWTILSLPAILILNVFRGFIV